MASRSSDPTPRESHPTPAELHDFAVGTLSDARMAELADHVESCPVCCQSLRQAPDDSLVTRLKFAQRGATSADQALAATLPAGSTAVASSAPTPAGIPAAAGPNHAPPAEEPSITPGASIFNATMPGAATPAAPAPTSKTPFAKTPGGATITGAVKPTPVRPVAVSPTVAGPLPQITGMHAAPVPGAPAHAGGGFPVPRGATAAIRNPQADTNFGDVLTGYNTPAPQQQTIPLELANHPRYEILSMLGAGGMGVVYKARHRMMDRMVALKVMAQHLFADPEALGRFRREVKTAASLNHPNVVTAYDAEQAGSLHFLVCEFIEGVSLERFVEQNGPLPPHWAAEYGRQAAEGLQAAQAKGMVHRDIKPQNLMLTPEGEVKILDFGLARVRGDNASPSGMGLNLTGGSGANTHGGLTRADIVLGTPDYIAPEQANNSRNVDTRADVYSLGCTLFFLLTGRPPFPDGSTWTKLSAHIGKAPPSLRAIRPDLPPGLEAVVNKMMAKKPEKRYQTPGDAADALRAYVKPGAGSGLMPRMADAMAQQPMIASWLAAVAGAALLAWLLWPPSPGKNREEREPVAINVSPSSQSQVDPPAKNPTPPKAEPSTSAASTAAATTESASPRVGNDPVASMPADPASGGGLPNGTPPTVSKEAMLEAPVASKGPIEIVLPPKGSNEPPKVVLTPPQLPEPPPGFPALPPPPFLSGPPQDGASQGGALPTGAMPAASSTPPAIPARFRRPKALVVIPPTDLWFPDMMELQREFNNYGVGVETASSRGGEASFSKESLPQNEPKNARQHIDHELANVRAEDYLAIVFVGAQTGPFGPKATSGPIVQELLAEAQKKGVQIGSVCVGVKVLGEHGLLVGQEALMSPPIDEMLRKEGKSGWAGKVRWTGGRNTPVHSFPLGETNVSVTGDPEGVPFLVVAMLKNIVDHSLTPGDLREKLRDRAAQFAWDVRKEERAKRIDEREGANGGPGGPGGGQGGPFGGGMRGPGGVMRGPGARPNGPFRPGQGPIGGGPNGGGQGPNGGAP